ncbi:PRMT5 arginine-N-methyltransferase-domain-containing protein [Sporodiniella umbellata]|nr:PRMT5 arginine-N-methyltransferase-domain-containing protein [Sporodiniella umbellata]
MSNSCNIGLLISAKTEDVEHSISTAESEYFQFIVAPISKPSFKRILDQSKGLGEEFEAWQDRPVFQRDDLLLNSTELSSRVLGHFAEWFDLDSLDDHLRICSEIAFKQEAEWASHIGLKGVIFPRIGKEVHNTARVLNSVSTTVNTLFCVRVPVMDEENPDDNVSWKNWNRLRTLTGHTNHRISVALELTSELPEDELLLDIWLAEPVREIIIPSSIFIFNDKGYPVLKKPHQNFLKKLLLKMEPDIILTEFPDRLHSLAAEYIGFLSRRLPELNEVEKFASGFFDSLQLPLQPLADNLENQTYETFERDPVKYQQYEKAVYQALVDRVDYPSEQITTIMVVGAGRGPLVNCCIRASEKSLRKIHIYALEKNPNAFVTLQNAQAEIWGDRVTLVFADMRHWKPKNKCDILVSELLGSFGDNELSPECLDGAQKFLKEDGISIPTSYETFVAPMASNRLFNSVSEYKSLSNFETPYVVMFRQFCQLASPEELWTFVHPNKKNIPADGDPMNNSHNQRYNRAEFVVKQDTIMHGFAGYFDCKLYGNTHISIHPETHSPDMFSWFPIFFPVQTPIQITKNSIVTAHFWRLGNHHKVWYEWSVTVVDKHGAETYVSPIHNPGGRSYYVGL